MVRPPRVAGPSVAGLPCSARTSARARAPSTVPICCRSTAAWCSRRAHRCGPPDTSALASPSCPDRSLGSVAHGRASVPSQRSRSFRPGESNECRLPSTRSMQTFTCAATPRCGSGRVGSFSRPERRRIARGERFLARLVHQLVLVFRRAWHRCTVGNDGRHDTRVRHSRLVRCTAFDRHGLLVGARQPWPHDRVTAGVCLDLPAVGLLHPVGARDPRSRDRTRRLRAFPCRTSDTDRHQVLSS